VMPIRKMCQKYNRTRNSIVGKANKMGLPRRVAMNAGYSLEDRT
jgi:hypothetical protein